MIQAPILARSWISGFLPSLNRTANYSGEEVEILAGKSGFRTGMLHRRTSSITLDNSLFDVQQITLERGLGK
jgi:hypothetical protein